VPLSLLPAAWIEQQQWLHLPMQPSVAAAQAMDGLQKHLPELPSHLNRMQRLVGRCSGVLGRGMQMMGWYSDCCQHN
jgi:hypothetical protein